MAEPSKVIRLDRTVPESESVTTDNPVGGYQAPEGRAETVTSEPEVYEASETQGEETQVNEAASKATEQDKETATKGMAPWAKYSLIGTACVAFLGIGTASIMVLSEPSSSTWRTVTEVAKSLPFVGDENSARTELMFEPTPESAVTEKQSEPSEPTGSSTEGSTNALAQQREFASDQSGSTRVIEGDATAKPMTPYESALYAHDSAHDSEIDSGEVDVNVLAGVHGLEPRRARILAAHLQAREALASADGAFSDTEFMQFVGETVAEASMDQGLSLQESNRLVESAIQAEGRRLGLEDPAIKSTAARVNTTVAARQHSITELEVQAIAERAAVMEANRGTTRSPALEQMGNEAVREVIASGGRGPISEEALYDRSLSVASKIAQQQGTSEVEHSSEAAQITEANPRLPVDQTLTTKGFLVEEVAAIEARNAALGRAEQLGVSNIEAEVLASRAQVKAVAAVYGAEEQLAIDDATRLRLDTLGVPESERSGIVEAVIRAEGQMPRLRQAQQFQESPRIVAARERAKAQDLSLPEAAALVAQEKAQLTAQEQGLSEREGRVLAARSQAAAVAIAQGANGAEVEQAVQAAQNAALNDLGVPDQERAAILSRVVAVNEATSTDLAQTIPARTERLESPLPPIEGLDRVITNAQRDADSLGLSEADKEAFVARAKAAHVAEQIGLNDTEKSVFTAQAQARAFAEAQEVDSATAQQITQAAVQSRLTYLGIPEAQQKEAIARVQNVNRRLSIAHNPSQGPVTQADIETSSITEAQQQAQAQAVETATSEADRRGMTGRDKAAFVARARASVQAKQYNLTGAEAEAFIAIAQAEAVASHQGASEQETREIVNTAGQARLNAMGVTPEQQAQIFSALSRLDTQGEALESLRQDDAALAEKIISLESRVASLSEKVDTIVSLAEENAADYQRMSLDTSKAISDMKESMEAGMASIKEQVTGVGDETDRLTANFGWYSNRLCEAEAMAGSYSNPKACKAIYEKHREQASANRSSDRQNVAVDTAGRHQDREPVTGDTGRFEPAVAMPSASAQDRPAVDRRAYLPETRRSSQQVQPSRQAAQRTYGQLPTTTRAGATQTDSSRVYGNLPQTHSERQEQTVQHVVDDACVDAVEKYRYLMISEHAAMVRNQWGGTQRLVEGSYLPELGAVLHFQAKNQPRFILFENGVVCR